MIETRINFILFKLERNLIILNRSFFFIFLMNIYNTLFNSLTLTYILESINTIRNIRAVPFFNFNHRITNQFFSILLLLLLFTLLIHFKSLCWRNFLELVHLRRTEILWLFYIFLELWFVLLMDWQISCAFFHLFL